MSFVDEDDVFALAEGMFAHILKKTLNKELKTPFPRITHKDAKEKYGTDKPDLRFGMEITDFRELFKDKDFAPFKKEQVRGLMIKGGSSLTRKKIDSMSEKAKDAGLGSIFWAKREDTFSGSIGKIMDETIAAAAGMEKGDLLIISAGDASVFAFLGNLRNEIAHELKLHGQGYRFLWVYDFPVFETDEKTGRLTASHHVFTQPKAEDIKYLKTEPLRVRGRLYDLVCNGNELASGSIRNHERSLQEQLFSIVGIDKNKYTMLLDALEYGAPPHGGIAPGIDRIIMILAGLMSLRGVIAFPKTTTAQGLLEGIPDTVTPEQLKELHLKFEEEKNK